MVHSTPFGQLDSYHDGLLKIAGQLERGPNVFGLARLITTSQKDDEFIPALNEIHQARGELAKAQWMAIAF